MSTTEQDAGPTEQNPAPRAEAGRLARQGWALAQSGQWERAAQAYRTAIELADDVPQRWYFRLGTAAEHLGRWGEVGRCYHRAMAGEPDSTPADLIAMMQAMLAAESREFPGRRAMLVFVAEHLDEIRGVAADPLPPVGQAPAGPDPIYFYWAQGMSNLPEVVRLCRRRLLDRAGDRVVELDDTTADRLVSLPPDIEQRGIAPTHRSDLLRLQLLNRYGGSWLDATCLVRDDPTPQLQQLRQPSGWFCFAKRRTTLATWLMSSVPGHPIPRMLYAALVTYWRHHERLGHYFALHYLFEALTRLDTEFARLWEQTPRLGSREAFALRWNQAAPYEPDRYREMLAASFVHKLTWKYPPEQAAPGTMLGRLLQTM